MCLRRPGRKKRFLKPLLAMFPKNINIFVGMFMGSGCVSFAMTKRAKHIIANDIDDDIFNLFWVLKEQPEELIEKVNMTPHSDSLFQHWKQTEETDRVWQAVRFLWLSNFSYLGTRTTMKIDGDNGKKILLAEIKQILEDLKFVQFLQSDFRKCLTKVSIRRPETAFIYADPPYLDVKGHYSQNFKLQDSCDLFEMLVKSKIKFAISEYRNQKIVELAEKHNLQISLLKKVRRAMTSKNGKEEILITNYMPSSQISLI